MTDSQARPSSRDLGQLIRTKRRSAGLTQAELADRLSMSQRWVSDLERGVIQEPRMETLYQISDIFDIPIYDLIISSRLAEDEIGARQLRNAFAHRARSAGRSISEWRESAGLSIDDVARATGLSTERIQDLENDVMFPSVRDRHSLENFRDDRAGVDSPTYDLDFYEFVGLVGEDYTFYPVHPLVAEWLASFQESQNGTELVIDLDAPLQAIPGLLEKTNIPSAVLNRLLKVEPWTQAKISAFVRAVESIETLENDARAKALQDVYNNVFQSSKPNDSVKDLMEEFERLINAQEDKNAPRYSWSVIPKFHPTDDTD